MHEVNQKSCLRLSKLTLLIFACALIMYIPFALHHDVLIFTANGLHKMQEYILLSVDLISHIHLLYPNYNFLFCSFAYGGM